MFGPKVALNASQKERLKEELIPEVINSGFAVGSDFATESQMENIQREIKRFRPNVFLNNVLSPFVFDHRRITVHSCITQSYPEVIRERNVFGAGVKLFTGTPKAFLPNIIHFGNQLGSTVQEYGTKHNEEILRHWRLGAASLFNYNLPHGRHTYLEPHKDSESTLVGVRFALAIGPALLTVEDQIFDTNTGDLELFLGSDLAKVHNTELVEHSVTPLGPKATIVFDACPIKI